MALLESVARVDGPVEDGALHVGPPHARQLAPQSSAHRGRRTR